MRFPMRPSLIQIEAAEVLMVLVAIVGFVVIMLSKVPEWTNPGSGVAHSAGMVKTAKVVR